VQEEQVSALSFSLCAHGIGANNDGQTVGRKTSYALRYLTRLHDVVVLFHCISLLALGFRPHTSVLQSSWMPSSGDSRALPEEVLCTVLTGPPPWEEEEEEEADELPCGFSGEERLWSLLLTVEGLRAPAPAAAGAEDTCSCGTCC